MNHQIQNWINNNPVKAIIIVGISIRILLAALYQHITLYPDSDDYLFLAERLWNFDLSGYEGQRSPGYPFLIILTGFSNLLLVITQSFVGICTLIVAYSIMLILNISKDKSLKITLFLSCYLPAVFFEFAVLTETLTLLIINLIFYFHFKLYQQKEYGRSNFVILSLLCGYLVFIKPFYIFLPFILIIFFLINNTSNKRVWIQPAMFCVLPLFVFSGWSYINKVNTGYFVSSTFYGFNLAQNCVSFAEKTTPEYMEIGVIYAKYRDNRISDKEVAMAIWEAYPELQQETGLSFPDLSEKLYSYSIATIRENPVAYLKQVFVSWRDFWKTSLYWEPQNFGVSQAGSIVLYLCYLERMILQLIKILFVMLIPVNIVFAIRKKQITPQLIISVTILFASLLQAFSTYGTNSRYSFPLEMLIVISVALNYIQYKAHKKQETA